MSIRTERWLLSLTIGLALALLTFSIMLKKPICIESKVVDKIDRVTSDKKETIYRCSSTPAVAYSRYFDEQLPTLEARIDGISGYLHSFGPLKSSIKLTISEVQPILFKIDGSEIKMGSKLVQTAGHLERAIIKVWINEKVQKSAIQVELFKEVVADFLLYTYAGKIDLVDPISQLQVKIGNSRWPHVLKSVESYCDSPWKASEHYIGCHQFHKSTELNRDEILTFSLRPLLTQSWVNAYQAMGLAERIRFFKLFARFLQTQSLSSEKAIESLNAESHPLKLGVKGLKRITDLMNSSSLVQDEIVYREFYSEVTQNLHLSGVSDSFAEAYFDFLIEIPEVIDNKSALFKTVAKAAERNPKLQVALRDKNQIWILPNKESLPLTTFDEIKTQHMVYLACLGLKEIDVKKFTPIAEKLLLIKGCQANLDVKFESLFRYGVTEFSKQNKHLAFIQFHLPSFELKARELSHIKNFFDLVNNRDITKPEFQTLGWRQIQWFEDYQAYRPQATVDAIELFRGETSVKKVIQ